MNLHLRMSYYLVIAVIIFLTLAGGAFYFLDFRNQESPPEVVNETSVDAPIPAEFGKAPHIETPPQPPDSAMAKPSFSYRGEPLGELNADPKVIASVGAALAEKYQKDLIATADRLRKNPANYDDWLGVAYIKKLFSNYVGVRDALEHAKIVNPENPIAYFNLGELYAYELHDSAKAEENYKTALRLNPYHLDYYIGLSNFYEDVSKDLKKAEQILLAALEKIPHTEVNLFTEIGAFYRDQNDYPKAIEYFEKALGIASDSKVRKSIEDEIIYIRSK